MKRYPNRSISTDYTKKKSQISNMSEESGSEEHLESESLTLSDNFLEDTLYTINHKINGLMDTLDKILSC